jgi:hypothetical protein
MRKTIRKKHVQHILRQLAQQESAFLDRSIIRAENERTELAKNKKNDPIKEAIEANHQIQQHQIKLSQQGRNTAYTISSSLKRLVNKIANPNKQTSTICTTTHCTHLPGHGQSSNDHIRFWSR